MNERTIIKQSSQTKNKIVLFGHFGSDNLGNESTLQAMLGNLRRLMPNATLSCACTVPGTVARDYQIVTRPISETVIGPSRRQSLIVRVLRKVFIGIPLELYRWFSVFRTLLHAQALIVPGTGLLTDAYGLLGWGPYNTFKWSVVAKLCRCKLLFVSVGAGPLYSRRGRTFVKAALRLADFKSYRDTSTAEYLESIGLSACKDLVSPDLALSLPESTMNRSGKPDGSRRVVGLGLMEYAGRYSVAEPKSSTALAYVDNLVLFAEWLLANNYDVRLLIGDATDRPVVEQFRSILLSRLNKQDALRVIDEPAASVDELLGQIASTDLIVATRFHNVLLSILLAKPVMAISFHHKCSSLMNQLDLSEYCLDINCINANVLIERFVLLERDALRISLENRGRVDAFREHLDQQYCQLAEVIDGHKRKSSIKQPAKWQEISSR